MKPRCSRIVLLVLIILLLPLLSHSTTAQRTALIKGHSICSAGSFKNPVNEATEMTATLKQGGFSIIISNNEV